MLRCVYAISRTEIFKNFMIIIREKIDSFFSIVF